MANIIKFLHRPSGLVFVCSHQKSPERAFKTAWALRTYESPLHRQMRDSLQSDWQIDLLETCADDLAGERKSYWIDRLDCVEPRGLNVKDGNRRCRSKPYLRRLAKKLSGSGSPTYKPVLHTAGIDERIRQLYLSGESAESIGKTFGVSDQSIYGRLDDLGIPRRTAKQQWALRKGLQGMPFPC